MWRMKNHDVSKGDAIFAQWRQEAEQVQARQAVAVTEEMALQTVANNGLQLENLASQFRTDRETVLTAVAQNGMALAYARGELNNDREVVLTAVNQNGFALYFASDELQADSRLVLQAVQLSGFALRWARCEGWCKAAISKVVTAAIQQNGMAIQYAALEFQQSAHHVKLAVAQDGMALQFCSFVRGDREVVTLACAQNGHALQFASDPMRKDPACVRAAAAQTDKSLVHTIENLEGERDLALDAVAAYHRNRLSAVGASHHTEYVVQEPDCFFLPADVQERFDQATKEKEEAETAGN